MALLAFMALLAIFLSPSILPLYFMEFISGDQPASVQSAAKVLPLLFIRRGNALFVHFKRIPGVSNWPLTIAEANFVCLDAPPSG